MAHADANIQAHQGVPFDVAILASPGTGYLWLLHEPPAAIRLLKEETEQTQAAPVAGGTSRQLFHLIAASPGEYELVFELRRPWEADAVRRHIVQVHVS